TSFSRDWSSDVCSSDLVQVIIIPIALGILVQRFFPKAVAKSVTIVPLISVAAILIIVSAVTAANAQNVISSGFIVFLAVFLHNEIGRASCREGGEVSVV